MATEAIELDKDAFMRLVTQEHLQVEGPAAGYLYTGKKGKDGWELYKTPNNPWWLYQFRRVATQANAGGGAIIIDITIPAGVVAQLVGLSATNSGTNTCNVGIVDEDDVFSLRMGNNVSAAGTNIHLPSIGGTSATTANVVDSLGMIFGPGVKVSCWQTGAGAQGDTLTVWAELLFSQKTLPTFSIARSTNAANVTLAASSISEANTWHQVAIL